MPRRTLTILLTLVMAARLWTSEVGAESAVAPLVTAHPIYEGMMPGVVGTAVEEPGQPGLVERDPFAAGSLTFQAMAGYYVKGGVGAHGPILDYAPLAARLGYVVVVPCVDEFVHGFGEVLLEMNYSPITRTFGNYFAGPNLLLRYSFAIPECVLVPYLQVGGGFVLNDAWKTPFAQQSLIGEQFEFLLRSEAGVRYMISECVSLDIEGGFQHISNAGLARHNGGINNFGGAVGFTYFFGRGL